MLRKAIYTLAVILVLALGFAYYNDEIYIGDLNAGTVSFGDTAIVVEIAKTHAARQTGLSGRASLDPKVGMLFVFDAPDYHAFWMKDMNFSLDIIWLDKNFRVLDMAKNVAPSTYPQTFKPKEKTIYALEVNAGFADQNNIGEGDKLSFVGHEVKE